MAPADPPIDGPPLGRRSTYTVPSEGEIVVNKSLTIVLPIHNGETRLRACVAELLELASELTPQFAIRIIDDGSTDATYEVAEELAMRFPQVSVRRHRHRRGLGPTLEAAQRLCRSEIVIVHDGVTPLDPNQVRKLWSESVAAPTGNIAGVVASHTTDLAELSSLPVDHAAMERSHARVLGFQILTPLGDEVERPIETRAARDFHGQRHDTAPTAPRKGVGQIPPLPRPKFLAALATFGRGE